MATIRLKKRASSGSAGAPSSLAPSEVAFNEADKALYYGYGDAGDGTSDSIISIAGEGAVMHLGNVNQTAAGNKTFSGNVVVSGDLTVNGTTTTLATTNSVVKDALIELGNGTTGTPANDAGLVIERGGSSNAFIGWDESEDKFHIGTGSFTGASTGNLSITTGTLVGNLVGNVTGNVTGNTSGSAGSFTAGSASNLNSGTIPNARIANASITEAQLDIHNSPTTGYILKYTSNGLEWAAAGAGGENNQNAWNTFSVSGQSDVVADTSTDTCTFVAGSNVTITTNASGDSITFAATDTNTTYSVGDGGLTANNFTNTLKSKLDGIEASATADQTAAEIRTLVESASDSNVFTDADHTKLNGIESNATADQTDEEIQDIVGAMFSSNTETGITATYQDSDGTIDLVVGTLNQNTTGSAATLTTARNIGGVSFNGSASIDLPGVNTAGTQNTSGTAAIATTVTVADESSDTTCFPLFTTAASGNLGAKSGSNLSFNSSTGALTATSFVGVMDGGTF
tara:strand:- start:1725 stop:3266 length:1542 start_codon:yes stop_codon:yes gene_type:complete